MSLLLFSLLIFRHCRALPRCRGCLGCCCCYYATDVDFIIFTPLRQMLLLLHTPTPLITPRPYVL